MQNQILQHKVLDNAVDNWMLINPTKQQIFMLPKEESQMFPGRSQYFTGARPAGYTNDPMTESENRDSMVNASTLPYTSSFTETDYAGMTVYSLPANIHPSFADFKVYDPATNAEAELFEDDDESIRSVRPGVQMFRIPKDRFNDVLTDAEAIADNGGSSTKKNFGQYVIVIAPKYVECSVLDIQMKAHYAVDNMVDNIDDSDPQNVKPLNKRRTIFEVDVTNFSNTPWAFEQAPAQVGRLIGSVVEIWDASRTELKQTKIIGENNFNFNDNSKNVEIVLHPDQFGYDAPNSEVGVGDVFRIFPRETSFDQILIQLSYEDARLQIEQAMQFLMNDVVRDLTSGTFDVYDKDGFSIDSVTGNFDGKVLHRYQVFQQGKFEARKKLKINGQ